MRGSRSRLPLSISDTINMWALLEAFAALLFTACLCGWRASRRPPRRPYRWPCLQCGQRNGLGSRPRLPPPSSPLKPDVNFAFLFPMIYCLECAECFMRRCGHSAGTYSTLNTQDHLFLFLFVKY